MKKLIFILIVAVGLTACKKDEFSLRPMGSDSSTSKVAPTPDPVAPTPNPVEQSLWRIGFLVNDGSNVTSDFTGYTFEFHPDGMLLATKKGVRTEGHWSRRTETDQPKLNINFESGPLMALNNNWDLKEHHVSVIKLEFITSNDMTEYLNFQKIQ
jgi:hypothetical protein